MTSPTAGAWTITTSTPGNNAWDWDITVRNAGGTALSGRVCRPITASSSPTPPPGTCSTG
jgi:hypothetical protein